MTTFDQQVAATKQWFASPRFAGIVRLYSPREVAQQQGTISCDYTVARRTVEEFYARLREASPSFSAQPTPTCQATALAISPF